MKTCTMNSMQRVLTTLGHQEPDRVPFFLLLSLHGARHLNISIQEYFSVAETVAQSQLKLLERYKHDCLYSFYYGPVEVEAWGGEVIFRKDGPPNSGRPFIRNYSDIDKLMVPDINGSKVLQRILKTTELMKNEVQDTVPIIGVVMSPFSLPVMQMGFGQYIELIYEQEEYFWKLMELNTSFCVEWANAQLAAGATAICYFDPISSPTIIPKDLYITRGCKIAKNTISQINGPTATHLASGISLPIAEEISTTGTAVIGVSSQEDLTDLKKAFKNKLSVLGNLNGIEMRRWTEEETRAKVIEAIKKGAPGGGFILSDNHGEIPWQVSDETLLTISKTVHEFGYYPISE
ncbi:uroporphyrinogen decarboxylase family protein [Candidatus Cloacimonadota bacterium]